MNVGVYVGGRELDLGQGRSCCHSLRNPLRHAHHPYPHPAQVWTPLGSTLGSQAGAGAGAGEGEGGLRWHLPEKARQTSLRH